MTTRNLIRTVPVPVLALVLTYAPPQFARLDLLIHILLGTNTATKEDNDYIYESLCKTTWSSVSSKSFDKQWRPNLNGDWQCLYRLLETWIPREGFYSLLDAAPWGLLFRIRFHCGKIIGELVTPNAETKEVAFAIVPILSIEFGNNAVPSKIMLCNKDISNGALVFGNATTKTNEPRLTRHTQCPTNAISSRAITLVGSSAKETSARHGESKSDNDRHVRSVWNPRNANVPPEELVLALWSANQTLTLDWIDGPAREESFKYETGMPIIRPGLYSGVYHEMYGKFKREIILIQYKTYSINPGDGNAGSTGTSSGTGTSSEGNHHNGNAGTGTSSDGSTGTSSGTGTNSEGNHPNAQAGVQTRMLKLFQQEVFNTPAQKDPNSIFENLSNQMISAQQESIVVVLGRKVTGDIHVPMRQLTFGALVHPTIPLRSSATVCPTTVKDRGGKEEEYNVIRHWDGWGTLAYEHFQNPSWASGCLLQVARSNQREKGAPHRFGFLWKEADDGQPHAVSILERMPEQDMFQWFSEK